ncbi:hypothetical protein HELRODRAFT_93106 [Helobdella robusta]|uniref:Kazal-like domain-containing protein n=1 Tax=Helobdella robusta TaxID=6412 RepID=T1G8T7_HELRO|nr:hypothetical protein HELRODRAFT_93106 [Helobdella robusta]ESN97298.1 hypothetical protein HELRODRAFT_93106 [Helobdella robusta]
MTGECNRDCHCEGINFQPVCSQSQVQYFSPCHAGCSSKIHNPETNIYVCRFYFIFLTYYC